MIIFKKMQTIKKELENHAFLTFGKANTNLLWPASRIPTLQRTLVWVGMEPVGVLVYLLKDLWVWRSTGSSKIMQARKSQFRSSEWRIFRKSCDGIVSQDIFKMPRKWIRKPKMLCKSLPCYAYQTESRLIGTTQT